MRSKAISMMVLAIFLALLAPADAFWRMPCRSRSGLARVDPLVSNGSLSEHAHAIHGSSGKFIIFFRLNRHFDLEGLPDLDALPELDALPSCTSNSLPHCT
jgi:hypothetical protein